MNTLKIPRKTHQKLWIKAINFSKVYSKWTILHMTSHYYLQRAELRTSRHKSSAAKYVMEEMELSSSTIVALIALLFGIPLSWMLAYKDFRYKTILETLVKIY